MWWPFSKQKTVELLLLTGCWLASLGGYAAGEPSPVVGKLMSTPASLFSIGLDQLDREIERLNKTGWEGSTLKYSTGVLYDDDANRITISFYAEDELVGGKSPEEECKAVITDVRYEAFNYRENSEHSSFSLQFTQEAPPEANPTTADLKSIDEIIEIEVLVEEIACLAPLLGDEIKFEK